jgi:hypothetical protein
MCYRSFIQRGLEKDMLTKPRPSTQPAETSMYSGKKRSRSPLLLIGAGVTLMLTLLGIGAFVVLPHLGNSHAAAAVNMDCTLIVPPDPLTAKGLATPYQLVATNAANGACNEANKGQAAFVQGAVIDPATGQISIYNPLVIDQGTQPATAPIVPTLPNNGIVALWFGFNGNNLTLQGTNNSLNQGRCVNGQQGSIFGQFAYCNAPAFFAVANINIQRGRLTVPPLGTGNDGLTCPTVRDFSVVDMDQSDNVTTTYVISGNGQVAQATAANIAALQNNNNMAAVQAPQMQVNASDNRLLSVALDGALGCTAWQAPDLADAGKMVNALPLDELQAAKFQAAPIAVVPLGDPMTLNNAKPSLFKTTLYRIGVDQPLANNNNGNTTTYCTNLLNVQPARMQKDMQFTMNRPSPDAAAANSLFTFLAQRFVATYGPNGLNCMALLNKPDPITVTTDGNGVATAATINGTPAAANGAAGAGAGATTTTTQAVTGNVAAILDTNAGTAQLALNLNFNNFANQQFTVNVTDQATGKQILQQPENTDGNSANAASTVINGLQGLTAIPNTWVASITDANGNALGSAPFASNGATATATFSTTPAAGTTPVAGATPAAGTTPVAGTQATPAANDPQATPATGAQATPAADAQATPAVGGQGNQQGNTQKHRHGRQNQTGQNQNANTANPAMQVTPTANQ